MPPHTSCKDALNAWKKRSEESPADAKVVRLLCQIPPIKTMDARVLNTLTSAHQISLSTNAIDRFAPLNLENLRILSLGRNNIRRLERLEGLPNLEELWVSYNEIDKLSGIECLQKLKVLYMSNNQIRDLEELEVLKNLPELNDILFRGNPIQRDQEKFIDYRYSVLRILPLKGGILDGDMITAEEIEAAQAQEEEVDDED